MAHMLNDEERNGGIGEQPDEIACPSASDCERDGKENPAAAGD
jgi:hypothetical protein